MNKQKLSNDDLIEALAEMEVAQTDSNIITEVMLRLAHSDERARTIMHIVPEILLCSFVEAVTPMTKIKFGEIFEVIEVAMAEADKSLAAGNLDNMLERTALIEKARLEGCEAARKEKMPDFIEELLNALGKKPGSMH